MIVTGDLEQVDRIRRSWGLETVGLVPTMGYLHQGHISLVRRAGEETRYTVVSIFVNPTQFGPNEDLARYPRDLERDLGLLEPEGVELVFTPGAEVMYPADFQTTIRVGEVSLPLEGKRRPGHFEGVATVVAKLFNIIRPTHAYFGQKDAQQTVVVRRMADDLNFPVEIVVCPTVREPDGLALSSRNKYLSAPERKAASVLFRALSAAEAQWSNGERRSEALREAMSATLATEPLARVDYISVAHPLTLKERQSEIAPGEDALLSVAVYIGTTRLIDNILLSERKGETDGGD